MTISDVGGSLDRVLTSVHPADGGLPTHGARKIYKHLGREQARGHPELGHVPKRQVERLLRDQGLREIRRGTQFVTIKANPGSTRPLTQ